MEIVELKAPFGREAARELKAGMRVYLSGTILTARDAAHKRLVGLLDAAEPLPIEIADACIYYAGPCPAAPGEVIGPCGPTTSSRMDAYTPRLMKLGLTGMIGKGGRSAAVVDAMRECGAVYLAATGGAGMSIARCVKQSHVVAFEELGAEAIYELTVERLPLVVAIDAAGESAYV